jgi:integrase/recombinase XerD
MKAYLEREEIERLGDEARCLRDKLLVLLLSRLGCRVSEALELTVDDIDFSQGTVRIEHLKSRIRLVCTNCGARLGENIDFCW